MKKLFLLLAIFTLGFTMSVQADSITGETTVTLGADLTPQQKEQVLNEMGVSGDVNTITVTNAEEHKYLGNYIPNSQIGTKAISSSKITTKESGYGLKVQTNHITWVSKEMYMNALTTAGVKMPIFISRHLLTYPERLRLPESLKLMNPQQANKFRKHKSKWPTKKW